MKMSTTPHNLPMASVPVRHRLIARRRGTARRGFNFAEVLFAVMIMGIGFIMVAAIFPVALTQTKLTGEEVVASTIGRGGVNHFKQLGLTLNALPVTDLEKHPAAALPATPAVIPPNNATLHLPGKVISFRDNRLDPAARDALWRQVFGNLILPDDPRAGMVIMYRRGATYQNTNTTPGSPNDAGVNQSADKTAHVIVIGVNIRNRSIYEAGKDLYRFNPAGGLNDAPPATASLVPATLEPRLVYAKLAEGNANPDLITFYNGDTAAAARFELPMAAEGAYIVISDDQLIDDGSTTAVEVNGERNGRVYRLGVKRDDLGVGTWELAPDGNMTYVNPDGTIGNGDDVNNNIPARPVVANTLLATYYAPAGGLPAACFIVGRGYADPLNPGSGFEGVAQDTGVYVSIIHAN